MENREQEAAVDELIDRILRMIEGKGDSLVIPQEFQHESFMNAFQEFRKMRKKIKGVPFTEYGQQLIINRAKKLSNGDRERACEILDQSTMHGWRGLFELRKENNNGHEPSNGKAFKPLGKIVLNAAKSFRGEKIGNLDDPECLLLWQMTEDWVDGLGFEKGIFIKDVVSELLESLPRGSTLHHQAAFLKNACTEIKRRFENKPHYQV